MAEKVGFRAYMFDALVSQATAYRALGSIDRARDTLAKAISASEALRSSIGGSAPEREPFLERTVAPYYAMSDLLLDQGSTAEAFNFAERSKARTLTDVLESGKVDLTRALTADEKGRERDVNAKLASINTQLLNERLSDRPDQDRVADLESRLRKARLGREAFLAGLYASHPELKVQRGEFQPLSLKDCSELIPDSHTAILEFLLSNDRTDVFILSKADSNEDVPRLKAFSIKLKETELTDLIDRFHKSVAERDPTFSELSAKLYDLLLKPLSQDLIGESNLIIVPDQALWDLPFQALQSARNHFLIEDYAVSYAPSLTALREMSKLKRLHRAKQVQLLAFANPLVSDETSTRLRET
ncbi:MAG: CHAT domain-containing protein, partial [Blastocatellia bacterium]